MLRSHIMSENVKMALETVRNHKIRSFLTVLGVVIGVAVAIVVASIMIGVQNNVQDSLNEFGASNLWIFRFNFGFHVGRLSLEERTRKPLTYEDGIAIKEEVPAVKNVDIQVFPRQANGPQPVRTARYKGHELTSIQFYGALPSHVEVENGQFKDGRFFTDSEDLHRADVVVIGYDVAKNLFPDEPAVGKELQIDGNIYEVIGVFDKKKTSTLDSADKDVIIPYHTYRKRYPRDDENFISAMAYPGMKQAAQDQIEGLLRQRRRVPPNKPDNFGISSAEELGQQFRDIMAQIFLLVVALVSVGLLVGGVGVMNIMLMAVTERTREIGVRKAIGARKRDISFQFLTEAMTLTGAGGIIGVALSLAVSFAMRMLSFPSSVPVWAVVAALAVSSSVGLFFGIYPAMKAARLDPVDALRYE